MALFEIKNLTFTYPTQEDAALRDVSFAIREGEFLVICGKSGCGKSTLLRHFKTAMAPYGKLEGEILLEGRPLSEVSVREQGARIGYVLQSPDNQIVTDKVWHELSFGLENLGYDMDTIRLRVAEMASFFGIQQWFMRNVSELSGGQKQLLNLASVMAMQPDLLVLDEPTSQLDPLAAGDFLATLRKINSEIGTTIVLIEHRLEEVLSCADRVMVLEEGRILALAPPRKLGMLLRGNDMFRAMPVPMRIFEALGGEGDCPVTVREGREWLSAFPRPGNAEELFDAEIAVTGEKHRFPLFSRKEKETEQFVIETKDVWFRYEKDHPDVVQDLNLRVKKGELFCLLGGNGMGKSTTLSLLGRIHRPYRGKIILKGKDLSKYQEGELYGSILGILPQNPQCLFVRDTVEEDLWEMTGKKTDPVMLEEIICRTEIGHLLKQHPYDLSGGEQQRAALAKVLLLNPEILLLDEPTKGLDGFYKQKLAEILNGLKEDGKTILMVSHDVEFCAQYGDSCSMFFNGSIVARKPARKFFEGNSFYTTAANRMARKWCDKVVIAEDVVRLCGKEAYRGEETATVRKKDREEREWRELSERKPRMFLWTGEWTHRR